MPWKYSAAFFCVALRFKIIQNLGLVYKNKIKDCRWGRTTQHAHSACHRSANHGSGSPLFYTANIHLFLKVAATFSKIFWIPSKNRVSLHR